MAQTMRFRVAVVGYGPGGLCLACSLLHNPAALDTLGIGVPDMWDGAIAFLDASPKFYDDVDVTFVPEFAPKAWTLRATDTTPATSGIVPPGATRASEIPLYSLIPGSGKLGSYHITSNSKASRFIETFHLQRDSTSGVAAAVAKSPIAMELVEQIRTARDSCVPLPLMGRTLAAMATPVAQELERFHGSRVMLNTRVSRIVMPDAPSEPVQIFATRGSEAVVIECDRVVLATGARQHIPPELLPVKSKVVISDDLLRGDVTKLNSLLAGVPAAGPHSVVILGGAHSAFSAAALLLQHCFNGPTPLLSGPAAIGLIHRSKIRLHFNSVAEAHEGGMTEFPDGSVSPKGIVHAFGGIRGFAKDLHEAILSGVERRVQLLFVTDGDRLVHLLQNAHAIIWAGGYDTQVPHLETPAGDSIPLAFLRSGRTRLRDGCHLVHGETGKPLNRFLGTGIGFAVPAHVALGETDERVHADGLYPYTHTQGRLVIEGLIAAASACAIPVPTTGRLVEPAAASCAAEAENQHHVLQCSNSTCPLVVAEELPPQAHPDVL